MNTLTLELAEFTAHHYHAEIPSPEASSNADIDAALRRLRIGAERFRDLPLAQRLALVDALQASYLEVAEASVRAGCQAKAIEWDVPQEAEEWATGPWGPIRQLRLLRAGLQALQRGANPPAGKVSKTIDERVSINVFPTSFVDAQLFKGVRADVHLQRGITAADARDMSASFYKEPQHHGRVVCVLGAGNIAGIPAMDVLTKLFNEGKVCLLKMNPVNAYLGPYIERALKPAIEAGFVSVIYGGIETAQYAVNHPDVDEIHITGSDKTYNAIVWGQDAEEREQNMTAKNKVCSKTVTAELGNVTPVMLVPGPYSKAELRAQAEMVAADLTMNASFLCCSAKVLLLPRGWSRAQEFLDYLREFLRNITTRSAYYPGAHARWQNCNLGREGVETIGEHSATALPWTIFDDINLDTDPICVTEPFCSIISVAYVGSEEPIDFMNDAVATANGKLWGTLCATIIAHPRIENGPGTRDAFERAVRQLRYGTVSINAFNGMSFVLASTPWGAYPGADAANIQSGRGFVHNTAMLEGIEKTVMRWPLRSFPKPAYYPTHGRAHRVMRHLLKLEARQSFAKMPAVIWEAVRGTLFPA